MQGTRNINPNQDQFTSNVRPSTCLVRKAKQSFPEILVGASYAKVIEEKM